MAANILVVDDEQAIADLVEVYLNNENYNVFKFYNGKAALNCIEKENLDLAILDVMLPDINGFEICQIIRKKHNFPVIMLTANAIKGAGKSILKRGLTVISQSRSRRGN